MAKDDNTLPSPSSKDEDYSGEKHGKKMGTTGPGMSPVAHDEDFSGTRHGKMEGSHDDHIKGGESYSHSHLKHAISHMEKMHGSKHYIHKK